MGRLFGPAARERNEGGRVSIRTKRTTTTQAAVVLRHLAQRVLGGVPLEYYLQKQPQRPLPQLADTERLEIAMDLRSWAASLTSKGRKGRRSSAATAERKWKMALGYRLTKKCKLTRNRVRFEEAADEVGLAWYGPAVKGAPTRVLEAYGECKVDDRWRGWAAYMIRRFRREHPRLKGNRLRRSLSKSLCTAT